MLQIRTWLLVVHISRLPLATGHSVMLCWQLPWYHLSICLSMLYLDHIPWCIRKCGSQHQGPEKEWPLSSHHKPGLATQSGQGSWYTCRIALHLEGVCHSPFTPSTPGIDTQAELHVPSAQQLTANSVGGNGSDCTCGMAVVTT